MRSPSTRQAPEMSFNGTGVILLCLPLRSIHDAKHFDYECSCPWVGFTMLLTVGICAGRLDSAGGRNRTHVAADEQQHVSAATRERPVLAAEVVIHFGCGQLPRYDLTGSSREALQSVTYFPS